MDFWTEITNSVENALGIDNQPVKQATPSSQSKIPLEKSIKALPNLESTLTKVGKEMGGASAADVAKLLKENDPNNPNPALKEAVRHAIPKMNIQEMQAFSPIESAGPNRVDSAMARLRNGVYSSERLSATAAPASPPPAVEKNAPPVIETPVQKSQGQPDLPHNSPIQQSSADGVKLPDPPKASGGEISANIIQTAPKPVIAEPAVTVAAVTPPSSAPIGRFDAGTYERARMFLESNKALTIQQAIPSQSPMIVLGEGKLASAAIVAAGQDSTSIVRVEPSTGQPSAPTTAPQIIAPPDMGAQITVATQTNAVNNPSIKNPQFGMGGMQA